MIRVAARDRWRREIVSSSRRTLGSGIGRETGDRENAQDDENGPALPLSSLHPLPFALVSFQLSRPKSERTVPGQETSIARRGSRGRTHCAGTRRTLPGTSQGVPRGEALPLGEVNWTSTRRPPDVSSRVELHGRAGPRNERSKARPPGPTETYDIGTSQGGLRGVQRR
jgi:hypothetical protein